MRDDRRGCAQGLRQIQIRENFLALGGSQALQARGFHIDRMPLGIELACQACRGPNHPFGCRIRTHASQKRRGGLPDGFDGLIDAIGLNVALDPVRGASQRKFPQRHEVAFAEKMLGRTLRLVRHVHLSCLESRQQLIRRDIDQHDFVGRIEHLVGDGLPDTHVGYSAHHVVETFQVLHVERAEYVDTCRQQLIDILPALGVAHARHIGVRQLVNQNQLRMPRERCVQVEFDQRFSSIINGFGGQNFQAIEQGGGFRTAVGFHHADQHLAALGQKLARPDEHGVGLAHPGR